MGFRVHLSAGVKASREPSPQSPKLNPDPYVGMLGRPLGYLTFSLMALIRDPID